MGSEVTGSNLMGKAEAGLEFEHLSHASEAAARLAAIVESSEDAIASKDLNGIVTSWNASAVRMFGYTAEEMVGRPILTIIPAELRADEDMILSKIRRGERIEHFETVRLTKTGKRIWVSLTISPVKDEAGRIIGAAKIARDITAQKQTEQALRRAEKIAATAQLAASIAHEINNPMQSLINLLALINCRSTLDPATRKLLSMADTELSRMAHISRQLLAFYRESSVPVAVKISEVLEDVLEVFADRIHSKRMKLERRYEFSGAIQGYPAELRQLFANLIGNAIEAVADQGRLRVHVSTWREPVGRRRPGVRVLVMDSGSGIPPELRERIFEPFFTTKAERGTGLGLWVAKGIVSKHEGSLRVRSCTAPKRSGTVFAVFLPMGDALESVGEKTDAA